MQMVEIKEFGCMAGVDEGVLYYAPCYIKGGYATPEVVDSPAEGFLEVVNERLGTNFKYSDFEF